MGFFKKLRKRISKLKRFVKRRSVDVTTCAKCEELKGEISELNRQLGQVINHYYDSQQLKCVNVAGQVQPLVDDLNQQLLPRVDILSKQLAELHESIVSSSGENDNSCNFVSKGVPYPRGEIERSEVASEQHPIFDNSMATEKEIQREGDEEDADHLSRSQEILKMEKSHAECLHASIEQADKDFPESIALSADNGSSSPSTLEVPCPIEIAGSRSEINADPLDECSNEACRPAKGREEDNLSGAEGTCEDDSALKSDAAENHHGSNLQASGGCQCEGVEERDQQLWYNHSAICFYENLYTRPVRKQPQEITKEEETLESHAECCPSTMRANEDTCELQMSTASAADEISTSCVSGKVLCPIGETGSIHLLVNECDEDAPSQQEITTLSPGDEAQGKGGKKFSLSGAEETCAEENVMISDAKRHHDSNMRASGNFPEDEEDQDKLWYSDSAIHFYESLCTYLLGEHGPQEFSMEEETLESLAECHPSTILADEESCEPHGNTASATDEKSTSSLSGEVPCLKGEAGCSHLQVNKLECDEDTPDQQGFKNLFSWDQTQAKGRNEINLSGVEEACDEASGDFPEDNEDQNQLWYSDSAIFFYENLYTRSNNKHQPEEISKKGDTLESDKGCLHPLVMQTDHDGDTCEPHENAASAADERSTSSVSGEMPYQIEESDSIHLPVNECKEDAPDQLEFKNVSPGQEECLHSSIIAHNDCEPHENTASAVDEESVSSLSGEVPSPIREAGLPVNECNEDAPDQLEFKNGSNGVEAQGKEGEDIYNSSGCEEKCEENALKNYGSNMQESGDFPEDKVDQDQLCYSDSAIRFYENLYAHSAGEFRSQETSKEEKTLVIHAKCPSSTMLADVNTCEPHENTASAADEKTPSTVSGEVLCLIGEAGSIHLPMNKLECDEDASGQQILRYASSGNQAQGKEEGNENILSELEEKSEGEDTFEESCDGINMQASGEFPKDEENQDWLCYSDSAICLHESLYIHPACRKLRLRSQLQETSKEKETLDVRAEYSLQRNVDTCEPQESTASAADEKCTSSVSGEVPYRLGEAVSIHLPENELECDEDVSDQLSPGDQVQGKGQVPCLIREAGLIHLPVNELLCNEDASGQLSCAGKGEKKGISSEQSEEEDTDTESHCGSNMQANRDLSENEKDQDQLGYSDSAIHLYENLHIRPIRQLCLVKDTKKYHHAESSKQIEVAQCKIDHKEQKGLTNDPFVKPIEESSGNNCEVEFSSVTKQQLVEYLLETQNICLKSVFLRVGKEYDAAILGCLRSVRVFNDSIGTTAMQLQINITSYKCWSRIAAGRMQSNPPPDIIIEELPD